MKKQTRSHNYVAVTIAADPHSYLLSETFVRERSILMSPISHSWARHPTSGIIGVRFCSWMINQGPLPRKEKAIVNGWNTGESDFEIFFGTHREYDLDASLDDAYRNTSLLMFNRTVMGIAFPLFGSTLANKEIDQLEAELTAWDKPETDPESEADPREG